MFQFKKIVGALLLPHTIFLALLGVGVLMLWFSSRRRLARSIVTAAAAGFFLLSFTGTWSFLIGRMEYQYPVFDIHRSDRNEIDWIVVLSGGAAPNDSLPPASQLHLQTLARLTEGIRISRSVPQAKLLLSGDSNALIMRSVAQMLGVNSGQIVVENEAKDTEQEAVAIQRIVGKDRIVLVTSAIHLPRAMELFRNQGMEPIPAPADFIIRQPMQRPSLAWQGLVPSSEGASRSAALIHEYLGMLWERFMRRV